MVLGWIKKKLIKRKLRKEIPKPHETVDQVVSSLSEVSKEFEENLPLKEGPASIIPSIFQSIEETSHEITEEADDIWEGKILEELSEKLK